MPTIVNLPDGGYLRTIEANEIEFVPGSADPCKLRFAMPVRFIQAGVVNLGAVSFNILREDGRHEEKVLIGGRIGPSGEGQVFMATSPPGSDVVMDRVNINYERAYFHVPIIAPGLGTSSTSTPGEFRHPNGIIWGVVQGDGNFVLYKNAVPFDYTTGVAYWASGTVVNP